MKGADSNGLFGTGSLFLTGDMGTPDKQLDFFWQLVFCATAATIVSGAVAERIKFSTYLIYSALISLIVYPLFGHWVWGGGWLSKLATMTSLVPAWSTCLAAAALVISRFWAPAMTIRPDGARPIRAEHSPSLRVHPALRLRLQWRFSPWARTQPRSS
jgi:hypothetical protein